MKLYFVPSKLPRTITRKEWYELHRWCRVTEKRLEQAMNERIANLAAFGTTHPGLKRDLIDETINPPLLLGPYMDGAR